MSLISQNAASVHKRRTTAGEEEEANEPRIIAGSGEETEELNESKPENPNKKKRNREQREKKKKTEQEKEMKRLESVLFGSLYSPPEFGTEINNEPKFKQDPPLFFVDRSSDNKEIVPYEDEKEEREIEKKKPVWFDEEEERTEIDILRVNRLRKLRKESGEQVISGSEYVSRLRAQHAKLNPNTEWARLNRVESEEESCVTDYDAQDHDLLLRSNEDLIVKDGAKLLPGLIEFSRLVDANGEDPSNGPINSVQFHRNGQLLLTAGLDRRLRFFQVDGKRNPKIQSIFIEDCPAHKASFLPDGSEVILSGRRKYFYSFDLTKASVRKIGPLTGREEKSLESFEISPDSKTIAFIGNEGYILLVSSKTKELIGTLKMNGTARSLVFANNGNILLSTGGDGHVYHWDLRTMKCMHKGIDEGSLNGTSLSVSPDSSLFATGSSSGIVNIYKRDEFLGGKRKPVKSIENLTTEVDTVRFNHDAQILAISSRMKRNGLKLVHVPSFNVFSNWPGTRVSLQYPRSLDFSPNSGFLTVANAAGKVLLYKLHHYQNA